MAAVEEVNNSLDKWSKNACDHHEQKAEWQKISFSKSIVMVGRIKAASSCASGLITRIEESVYILDQRTDDRIKFIQNL